MYYCTKHVLQTTLLSHIHLVIKQFALEVQFLSMLKQIPHILLVIYLFFFWLSGVMTALEYNVRIYPIPALNSIIMGLITGCFPHLLLCSYDFSVRTK